ncbi:MAG: polysaccharide deacetylase family protein [Planctomycetales bacterium]|nr:polysaccharide deacetylase family protein [Planctomycetales bacterium]
MKNQALWVYQRVTANKRKELMSNFRAAGKLPISILFYHRVADDQPNDWTISRRDFAMHLDWLQDRFEIVSLSEAQNRIIANRSDRPTVAITFDDGYADNSDFAIPELSRRQLPATYFVATDYVREGKPFPHDVAAGSPLAPNTIDQLREYQSMGIEIGAHTRSHPDLGKITEEQLLRDEIVGSIEDLSSWLDFSVRYFAFPYGMPNNTSQRAVDLLQSQGISGFCTAYGAYNWPSQNGFHLRRIHADPGLIRLQNWLTLDPRKLDEKYSLPFVEPQSCQQLAPVS